MPFALIIIGLVLIIAGVRDTTDGENGLYDLVTKDFQGPDSFMYWAFAILVIGSIGYIPSLKPISRAFLVLVLIVLVLTNGKPDGITGGFFQRFNQDFFGSNTQAI